MTEPIAWSDFDADALQRAQAGDRPIVLLLTVPWCHHCRDLLASSFADPAVIAAIRDHFVAVHVDAERRPDVNERYGTGGWPSIAWLTPSGELIANDSWLGAAQLQQRLERVRSYWKQNKDDIQRGIQALWKDQRERQPDVRGRLSRQMVEDVTAAIYEKFDHRHGGFGDGAKFPHPEAIDFALVQVAKHDDERMREVVTVTLDRMIESPLHDTIHGGFFRFSKTPDWRSPNYEKLLDQNARVLRALLEAWQVLGRDSWRRAAEGIVDWMLTTMRDPQTGAFAGSQDADAEWYHLDRDGRARRAPPKIDKTIYCNANAMAISALFKAAAALGRPEWRTAAMTALQFLKQELFDGQEVYHYWDGTYHLPGMLSDQAWTIRALIDASQHGGDADLLLPAEAIAERAIARQKAPGGGFYDILHDPAQQGMMRRRNRSILENSVMAEALVRLSYLSRRPEFYREAIETLEAFAADYKEYGYYVAGYGRAVDLIFYEPLFLTIVAGRNSEQADELRRAALSAYVPSRIVQTLDPRLDPILMSRAGYQPEDRPVVHLTVGRTTHAIARSPAELRAAVERIEAQRRRSLRS
ncbi:MAG: thioredoxin domain-containing protein [Planctomycetes bacterium]|nr:thioredoxin domain-containing protein [Planctomycetota bacterium]